MRGQRDDRWYAKPDYPTSLVYDTKFGFATVALAKATIAERAKRNAPWGDVHVGLEAAAGEKKDKQ
jgi:hypothetical protein